LKAVKAVKIHNLSIRQVALEFNMNCIKSLLQKDPWIWLSTLERV